MEEGRTTQYRLRNAIQAWPTPKASADKQGQPREDDRGDLQATAVEAGLDRQAKLWATPTTQDAANNGGPSQALRNTVPLNRQASLWPTPRASENENRTGRHQPSVFEKGHGRSLSGEAAGKRWPTPLAADADGPKIQMSGDKRDDPRPSLRALVDTWPTPTTRDAASAARQTTKTGVMHDGVSLTDAMRQWPTPLGSRRGARKTQTEEHHGTMLQDAVATFPSSRPAPQTGTDGPPSSKSRPVLNPRFVAMLMGWPIGWTNCTSSATAAYRSWLRSHSAAFYAICSEDR